MRNILFLDFDGVINEGMIFVGDNKHKNVFLLEQKLEDMYVQQLVMNVNKICKEANFKIVVSSTWRKDYSQAELEFILRYMGIEAELIGVTPVDDEYSRGLAIQIWCEMNHDKFDSYYVLDDLREAFIGHSMNHDGYQTQTHCGFDDNAYQDFKDILKKRGVIEY